MTIEETQKINNALSGVFFLIEFKRVEEARAGK